MKTFKKTNVCVLFILSAVISVCSVQAQSYDLKIPDTVRIEKNKGQKEVSGTGIFMTVPNGLPKRKPMRWSSNDGKSYISVVSFYDQPISNPMGWTMDIIKKDRPKYWKKFKLGNYDAIIIHTRESILTNRIFLLFGDSKFWAQVKAGYRMNEKELKTEIRNAILSIYADKALIKKRGEEFDAGKWQ